MNNIGAPLGSNSMQIEEERGRQETLKVVVDEVPLKKKKKKEKKGLKYMVKKLVKGGSTDVKGDT